MISNKHWSSTLQEIVNYFSSGDHTEDFDFGCILVDIYLREKQFYVALKEVLRMRSLHALSRYYKPLAEKYPSVYFETYSKLLLTHADARMGRDHHREFAAELKKMKAIKGFENEFNEYIRMLREKYARRPAFIDEIRKL